MPTLSEIEWRYTAKKVRLGPFDATVVVPPFMLFSMHIAWWTFSLMLCAIVVLWVIELFFHMPLKIAARSLRATLAGSARRAVPWWKANSL